METMILQKIPQDLPILLEHDRRIKIKRNSYIIPLISVNNYSLLQNYIPSETIMVDLNVKEKFRKRVDKLVELKKQENPSAGMVNLRISFAHN